MKLQKVKKVAIKYNGYRVIYLITDVPVVPLVTLVSSRQINAVSLDQEQRGKT